MSKEEEQALTRKLTIIYWLREVEQKWLKHRAAKEPALYGLALFQSDGHWTLPSALFDNSSVAMVKAIEKSKDDNLCLMYRYRDILVGQPIEHQDILAVYLNGEQLPLPGN